jgi:hypothetical protein
MEERVVYLSADEDLTDILTRLEQAPARSIALVVPERSRALHSSVRVRLLRRRADEHHKDLLIVSGDQHIRALASRVGFSVVPSLVERPPADSPGLIGAHPEQALTGLSTPSQPSPPAEEEFSLPPLFGTSESEMREDTGEDAQTLVNNQPAMHALASAEEGSEETEAAVAPAGPPPAAAPQQADTPPAPPQLVPENPTPADSAAALPQQLDREELFGPDTTELPETRQYSGLDYTIHDTVDEEGIEADAAFTDQIRDSAQQLPEPDRPAAEEALTARDTTAADSDRPCPGPSGPGSQETGLESKESLTARDASADSENGWHAADQLEAGAPGDTPAEPAAAERNGLAAEDTADLAALPTLERPTVVLPPQEPRAAHVPPSALPSAAVPPRAAVAPVSVLSVSEPQVEERKDRRGKRRMFGRQRRPGIAPPPKPAHSRAAALRFLALSLLLLLLMLALTSAVLVVPTATVTLAVATGVTDQQFTLLAGPAEPTASGSVPGTILQMRKSGTATGIATGHRIVPGSPATGQVIIINNGSAPVTVPTGTLLTDSHGTRFVTTADATIQPTNSQGIANQAPVPIQAVTGGSAGNVSSGVIDAFVVATAFPNLTVTNPLPTTGGGDRQVPAVTAADVTAVVNRLRATLEQQEETALASAHPNGWLSAPNWGQARLNAPADGTVETNRTFSVTLLVSGRAMLVPAASLHRAAHAALDARLDGEHPARMVLPNAPVQVQVLSGSWEASPAPNTSPPSTIRLRVRANSLAGPLLHPSALRAHVAGASLLAADHYLLSQAGVQSVAFTVYPHWLTRLPFIGQRITIDIIGHR